jgi:hypothetical protein
MKKRYVLETISGLEISRFSNEEDAANALSNSPLRARVIDSKEGRELWNNSETSCANERRQLGFTAL